MVRVYKRTSNRQEWSQLSLNAAIEAVNGEGLSVNRAAIEHEVPRQTLNRYLRLPEGESNDPAMGRYKTVFSKQQEEELVAHIINMEVRFYGVTPREIRSLAYQLAEQNDIRHPFNKDTQLAGIDWYYGFRSRHPNLSLRSPEATSAARAQGFNRIAVDGFYDQLGEILETGKFSPSQIYNVDETAVVTVQTRKSKVLALKGRRQVGCITSAERGVLSTACICMSATGHFLPPMLLFPRQRLTEQLKKGAPPDTIFSCNSSGWMTVDDFNKWFDHFLKFTQPTPERPILLLLDGHVSHTKNLAFIEKARKFNVTVLSLPPHCSHKLQPLDISFMGPLKIHFSKSIEKFLKSHPGKVVTINEISELLGNAFMLSATNSVAVNGFRKAGIAPYNRFLFSDSDFAPAEVTDVGNPQFGDDDDDPPFYGFDDSEEDRSGQCNTLANVRFPFTARFRPADSIEPSSYVSEDSAAHPSGQCNTPKITVEDEPLKTQNVTNTQQQRQGAFTISPEVIHPLPKVKARRIKTGRNKQKATELTSDSYRNTLKSSQANKDIQQVKRVKKRISKTNAELSKQPKRRRKNNEKENVDDSLCEVCGACFSNSDGGEGWLKCLTCNAWYHQCSGDCCPTCAA